MRSHVLDVPGENWEMCVLCQHGNQPVQAGVQQNTVSGPASQTEATHSPLPGRGQRGSAAWRTPKAGLPLPGRSAFPAPESVPCFSPPTQAKLGDPQGASPAGPGMPADSTGSCHARARKSCVGALHWLPDGKCAAATPQAWGQRRGVAATGKVKTQRQEPRQWVNTMGAATQAAGHVLPAHSRSECSQTRATQRRISGLGLSG